MFSRPITIKRGTKGEPEKPFWISYADMMTALMVLFLVAMSVAMLAVTNTVREVAKNNEDLQNNAISISAQDEKIKEQNKALEETTREAEQNNKTLQKTLVQLGEKKKELEQYEKNQEEIDLDKRKVERDKAIAKLLDEVAATAKKLGITVNTDQKTIDFGNQAQFDRAKSELRSDQAKLLRSFIPQLLAIAREPLGQKWLKQVVVEGFASPEGTYLYNLNLSMKRSQRVLCILLDKPYPDELKMSPEELQQIRDLFLVGGYSFNATKKSYEESRRVEMRLEFLAVDEEAVQRATTTAADFEKCELDR